MLNSLVKTKQMLKNFFVLFLGLTGPVKNSFIPLGQRIEVYEWMTVDM